MADDPIEDPHADEHFRQHAVDALAYMMHGMGMVAPPKIPGHSFVSQLRDDQAKVNEAWRSELAAIGGQNHGKTAALAALLRDHPTDMPVMIPNVPYLITAAKEGGLDYRVIEDLLPDNQLKSITQQRTEQAFAQIMHEVEKRLLALPPGWRVATSLNVPRWGEEGSWTSTLTWSLREIEPGAPVPAPGQWTIYGPLTDEQRMELADRA